MMDVATDTSMLYRQLSELGWRAEVNPVKRDGNLIYEARLTGPAGQKDKRTGISEQWALVNALHFAQRQNFLRGAALENTMPTHQAIPGIRYTKAVKATERDPNHDYVSPYKSDFNDEMRAKAPESEQIPGVIKDHVDQTASDIDTGWYLSQDPHVWEQAVMNAFRGSLLSPRKDFRWNVVHYQDIADMPHDATSGDMFRRLEARRQAWNAVYRGNPLVHVRYKGQLKKLVKLVQERDPSLDPKDAEGIALGVIGKLMANAEKFYVAHVMKNPRRFNNEEWVDPPPETETISKAMNLMMGQLDMSLTNVEPAQGSLFEDEGEPTLTANAQKAMVVGLKPLNLEDYIQEARGSYELGSNIGPQEEDMQRARQGQKKIQENYGAFIYSHLEAVEAIGQHIRELAQYAHDDITKYGGTGHYFRNQALNLGILGTNPKVISLTWLLLAPKTSQLGTIDTHMARYLAGSPETGTHMPGNSDISAGIVGHYYNMERQLAAVRDRSGYSHIPLGKYQWNTWDMVRNKDAENAEAGSDHRGLRVLDPKPYGEIDWPVTQRKQYGSGQVNYYHPPEWLHDAFDARQEVAKDYVDQYGGYAQDERPEPSKPKPPKTEKRQEAYGRWGIPAPVLMQPEPVLAAVQFYHGDMNDVLLPLYHGDTNHEPEIEDWIPYEAEDDAIHHSNAYKLGHSLHGQLPRQAAKKRIEELADSQNSFKDAMRGYNDALREWEDRQDERTASSRSQEIIEELGVRYPTTYDIQRIAQSFEYPVDFEALDATLEDQIITQRTAGERDIIRCAALLCRNIQKATAHDATALVATVMFLQENGYPYAAETIDDVKLADVIMKMRTAEAKWEDVQDTLEDDITDTAEKKPDFRFVFYKGVLDIREWDHNLRFRNMIEKILGDNGKHLNDDNVNDNEIASGDVYKTPDGLDIELESLADNDIQNQAALAVQKWAEGINLIGPIKAY